jgi:hypothetical protein
VAPSVKPFRNNAMTAWEEIEQALSQTLIDRTGNLIELDVAPPLSDSEVEEVTKLAGVALPAELVELLHRCGGLEGTSQEVDFSGRRLLQGFGFEDAFPHALPIAHDGCGNFWVLDLTPETTLVAAVYFACHDPPIVLYQSPNLAHFVRELIRMSSPPYESAIGDVEHDRLFHVWPKNPGTMTRAAALASNDPELQAFASTLDETFTIVDLRHAKVGMGFSWGRHGLQTILRRHGNLPIFAYTGPKTPSLWARLTGRG